MADRVPFTWIRHLVAVPVVVADAVPCRFVLDTGIGINLVSSKLGTRLGLAPTGGSYTGRRMSGQEVPVRLFRLSSLTLGRHRWENLPVGELDITGLAPELTGVDGFLSLGLFEHLPVTIRARSQVVELAERAEVPGGEGEEVSVPMRVRREGPEVTAFVPFALPRGERAEVEVDTGTDLLILHDRYFERLKIPEDAPTTRSFSGQDETGHRYVRRVARLPGAVHPVAAPELAQPEPEAIFQKIIYDGLVGNAFLGRFDVTYDLPGSRLRIDRRTAEV